MSSNQCASVFHIILLPGGGATLTVIGIGGGWTLTEPGGALILLFLCFVDHTFELSVSSRYKEEESRRSLIFIDCLERQTKCWLAENLVD